MYSRDRAESNGRYGFLAFTHLASIRLQNTKTVSKKDFARNTNTDTQELRKDVRQRNTQLIRETIEHNKRLKVLRRNVSKGKFEINRIKNSQGQVSSNREEILRIVEEFYKQLYKSQHKHEPDQLSITEIKGMNQASEDLPDITKEKIHYAILNVKNGRAPGEGGAVIKTIKIVVGRIENKLDFYHQKKQAGFRSGFGTNDHLQSLKVLIEKPVGYNRPLALIFVDFEKAFDTVDLNT
ncbi:hypothetical protein HUJ04_009303 [Dendroctonus ponderosae]|nr:hypothetical protein HUJ04_009303 [Dendroctonus ponderosae]